MIAVAVRINWRQVTSGDSITVALPLLDAILEVTMVGDVITGASWRLDLPLSGGDHAPLAIKLRSYLLNPSQSNLAVALLEQGTEYSRKVWNALLAIPVGQVRTYSELADQLASGSRAIAGACRNNPYAGIIPCHRVVAKSGIGGFMGQVDGEFVALKQRLLTYECTLPETDNS